MVQLYKDLCCCDFSRLSNIETLTPKGVSYEKLCPGNVVWRTKLTHFISNDVQIFIVLFT